MRVDADTYPGKRWTVWDVPACRALARVMWVDDETMQVAVHGVPVRLQAGAILVDVQQRRRVVVLPEQSLVLVDPVDEEEPGDIVHSEVRDAA